MWFKFSFKRILTVAFSLSVLFVLIWKFGFYHVDEGMLPGRYTLNAYGNESLIVYSNHTYLRRMLNGDGKWINRRGTWKYDGTWVEFNGFYTDKGYWPSEVEETNTEIRFRYSDEMDVCYKRIK